MKRKDTPSAVARRIAETYFFELTFQTRLQRAIARALKAAEERGCTEGFAKGAQAGADMYEAGRAHRRRPR